MISVQQAEKRIFDSASDFSHERVKLVDLLFAPLAESISADRAYPPFDRVCMDGIAISYASWKNGRREFSIEGIQKAGEPAKTLEDANNCLEIMTGAALAKGCDTVVRYEDLEIVDQVAKVRDIEVRYQQNIHFQGSDYQKGDRLIGRHKAMNGPRWGVAASVGQAEADILQPRIAIVSTGDELVEVDQKPEDFQIRRSNSYALAASLKQQGFTAKSFHCRDEAEELFASLGRIAEENDILILSGGVSKGKFDFLPEVLADLKFEKVFHGVAQRPGKPFFFGLRENKMAFGLPGNPVSALVCLHRYVLPLLQSGPRPHAILTEEIRFKKELTYFATVQVSFSEDGKILATPVRNNGSGDFASLIESSGFIELPAESKSFAPGEAFPFYSWGGLL